MARLNCLAWLRNANGLLRVGRRVDIVGKREIEHTLEGVGRDADLPPHIVERGTSIHQVHAIFHGDPDRGLKRVFQAFFVLGHELFSVLR